MIIIRNLHKRFGSQIVLDGIDAQIEPGKTTTIVGPSGAGKSVLLKLIMGILPPDAGQIFIGNQEMTAARRESQKNKIRSQLGVLFQSAALFDSLTVFENVAFPLIQREKIAKKELYRRVFEMLEALSLQEYARYLPQEISMGTRKRVGMARALITQPRVLLVDEPNTGLDPLVGQEVYELFKACRDWWNFTALVISHELPEVFQISDKVAMLYNGKILEEGNPSDLLHSTNPTVQQFLNGRKDGPIKIK